MVSGGFGLDLFSVRRRQPALPDEYIHRLSHLSGILRWSSIERCKSRRIERRLVSQFRTRAGTVAVGEIRRDRHIHIRTPDATFTVPVLIEHDAGIGCSGILQLDKWRMRGRNS